ncbi:MAG: hypothetical protein A2X56_12055 [Nitrospirae bacterium GWC2_57_13]|jgi:peptidoglycan/LPS O-acetylase OafA/YrhL|nr:MAG: hypothetical protein A2X56_12055 [Nitrospirae bacterium GWC2_57_13]HAS53039.1 hypothetical protein [Nitrospiraceae bacterium]
MKDISVKAVVLGFLADVGATAIVVVVLVVAAFFMYPEAYANEEQIEALFSTTGVLVFGLVIGLLCTMLGGFVAGSIAKKAHYLNSGLVGGLGVLLGVAFVGQSPLWYDVVTFITIIPAAMLGGHLAKGRHPAPLN